MWVWLDECGRGLLYMGVAWWLWAWFGEYGRDLVNMGVAWCMWAWLGECGRGLVYIDYSKHKLLLKNTNYCWLKESLVTKKRSTE